MKTRKETNEGAWRKLIKKEIVIRKERSTVNHLRNKSKKKKNDKRQKERKKKNWTKNRKEQRN